MAQTKEVVVADPIGEDAKKLNKDLGKDNSVDSVDKMPKNADPWQFQDIIKKQAQREHKLAYEFLRPKWDKWIVRLKLYNNQKRSAEAIGDPLLFTISQTIVASLYSDELTVQFEGTTGGDQEQAENQTLLAKYDSKKMRKDRMDYDWIFNTCFFGRGLVLMQGFDRKRKIPCPEVIDNLAFLRDPDASSVNGDEKGRGGCRFFGREVRVMKRDMKEMNERMEKAGKEDLYRNLDELGNVSDKMSEIERNQQERKIAAGYNEVSDDLTGDNAGHLVKEWWTWWNDKMYFFTFSKDFGVLLRASEVKTRRWPVVERSIFPVFKDFDGVSVPDLVEDKQRARATVLNLSLKGIKSDQYPNYLYNNLLIKNKAALAKFEFNKFTGVPGNPAGAVVPIERKGVKQEVGWILDMMNAAAQQATATPDIKQGAAQGKVKSATEIAQVTVGVDTRFSLSAKIFGWSEEDFWLLWLELYGIYFKEGIDDKVVRIAGPLGPSWRPLNRENLIGENDPDIYIESKVVADAKRMNDMNMMMAAMNQGMAMDPTFNKRFALKELYRKMGMPTDTINRMLPQTFDEYEASKENEQLNKNKPAKISMEQDHITHIQEHTKALDTKAKKVHIALHYMAMFYQRKMPQLAPQGAGVAQSTDPAPMETGSVPSPRSMAQDSIELQAPTSLQA